MGYVKHHAIVVTSWNDEVIEFALVEARRCGLAVCLVASECEGYHSVFVAPDGSKEGWAESDDGDKRRGAFKGWMRAQQYEDGGSSLEWVEVAYGNDDHDAIVTDHQWKDKGAT